MHVLSPSQPHWPAPDRLTKRPFAWQPPDLTADEVSLSIAVYHCANAAVALATSSFSLPLQNQTGHGPLMQRQPLGSEDASENRWCF